MPKLLKFFMVCLAILFIIPNLTFAAPGTVRILFFHSEGCDSCRTIKTRVLPVLQEKYGSKLEVKELEISSLPNFELLLKLQRQAGRRIDKTPPLIFIGQDILEGTSAIRERLDGLVEKYQAQGGSDFPDVKLSGVSKVGTSAEFRKISLAALIAGALMDGINPCAFTTLIFLISYLAFIGRKGRQLLSSGLLFSLGVFGAYFLAGLGIIETIKQLQTFRFIDNVLLWIVFGMAVLLGALNFYDYFALKNGRLDRVKLGLGDQLQQRIHGAIRTQKHAPGSLSSLVLGATVGVLELPCTGQLYFPIILMVREMSPVRAKALGYLLLYNFIFILPLLIVFAGAYFGLSSKIMTKLVRDHSAKVKLWTALFFFGLALLLVCSF